MRMRKRCGDDSECSLPCNRLWQLPAWLEVQPTETPLVKTRLCLALVGLALAAAGCGSDERSAGQPATSESTSSAAAPTTANTTATDPKLVGLWRRVNRCPELIGALGEAGLGAAAASVVGDFFPGSQPEELAEKEDLCEGAEPFVHYHFFDANGRFGSLDEEQDQVDDGMYEVIDEERFRIGDADTGVVFHYKVDGDRLSLTPEITAAMLEEALASPMEFSPAGWSVAVAYPGQEWKRVPCDNWC
jgi:hypothetical protein